MEYLVRIKLSINNLRDQLASHYTLMGHLGIPYVMNMGYRVVMGEVAVDYEFVAGVTCC